MYDFWFLAYLLIFNVTLTFCILNFLGGTSVANLNHIFHTCSFILCPFTLAKLNLMDSDLLVLLFYLFYLINFILFANFYRCYSNIFWPLLVKININHRIPGLSRRFISSSQNCLLGFRDFVLSAWLSGA